MNSFDISMKALEVARQKLNITASNIANMDNPNYRKKEAIVVSKEKFEDMFTKISYPEIKAIEEKEPEYIMRFDPSNPNADEKGFVKEPLTNPVDEMMNLIEISRYYEANLAAIEATRSMSSNALNIGR